MKYIRLAGVWALATALFSAPNATAGPGADPKPNRKLLDPANIDGSVSPGQNFYRYANGAWMAKNPIPPSETRWGSFSELQEGNFAKLHALLERAAASGAAPGTSAQKVGDFYRSGMDSAAIEKAGIVPLQPLLQRIDRVADYNSLVREIGEEHARGVGSVFGFYVAPDDKNVIKQLPQFYQGGLGLPDRDYYFNPDARSVAIRTAYKQYLRTMLGLLAGDRASKARVAADADAVYALEERLAKASMTRVEQRDPYRVYNKFALSKAANATSGMDWRRIFPAMGLAGQDTLLVGQPRFFSELAEQLRTMPIATWKAYLRFHLVNDLAPFLPAAFDEARFDFYGRTVRGQQAQKERWKRVLTVVDGSLGELLGEMYVAEHFKPEAKVRMMSLVSNLQETYAARIQRLDWMSAATKKRALAKLETFVRKIGYPDKWKDYSRLTIVPDGYLANALAASGWEYVYNIGKLRRPVDKAEWAMTPPTVNAYYNPAFNEIVFPAGILQYPFFDDDADDAVNYGGIGAVIGHEMTHGFDDQGRQYDADGNLADWWTEEDAKRFTEKADVVVRQYDAYTILDTVHVNGRLTLGENLADLGGLAIAYEAFLKTPQAKKGTRIDGFTPKQRFFLSWAQVWRANTRPEEAASRIVTDPHSPNELRCNGPLSNMPEFYEAFGVKEGDKMWRPDGERAKVW